MNDIFENISNKLQVGDMKEVMNLCKEAIDRKASAQDVLNAMLGGMNIIGEKFKNGQVFVPEVLIAARAMNGGLTIIKPLLETEGVEPIGKIVLGTVKGDLHDIGKNLVRMMFAGAGFEVIDLGVDVTAEQFFDSAEENDVQIIAMSALLTTTMNQMKEVIDYFEEKGVREKYKIMVGGAPVNKKFSEEIGADMYTDDAATAAEVAKSYVLGEIA